MLRFERRELPHPNKEVEPMYCGSTIRDTFSGECPYCGGEFSFLPVHQMECVANQVLDEQMKSLQGIVDELKNGQEREEVVEMLEYHIESAPNELGQALHEERQDGIQNLESVFGRRTDEEKVGGGDQD